MTIKQILTLSIASAEAHLIQAELTLSLDKATTLTLALPRWIPGSYLLRDFAKHLQGLSAVNADGETIPLYRTSVSTWSMTANAGVVTIRYQIYAFDQSVRACYVTPSYAFINPAAAALYVMEWRDQPYQLILQQPVVSPDSPQATWQVFTTLPSKLINRSGFGHYLAGHYDELIEHPLLIGKGVVIEWQSAGIAHQMVLIDEAPLTQIDTVKIATDLQAICQAQQDFWGSPAPYSRYLFQVMVTADGYGGLEHTNSTALLTSRKSLAYVAQPDNKHYEDFLGLCSHEYFHAWMVKRIRPQAFIRPDLQSAVITSLLWVFEGFTSLYDDWFLFRSGRIGSQRLLERWGETLSRALLAQGIGVQSVADASREAWIKYYQQNENSINSQVSYYTQGATLAMVLLCELFAKGVHLDHLMAHWWQSWQAQPQDGLQENQLARDLALLVPEDWVNWVEKWVENPTTELANHLQAQLPILGLRLETSHAQQTGWKLKQEHGRLLVKQVLLNSPAHSAGVQVGDELLAINQWRCHSLAQTDELLAQLAREPDALLQCLMARKGYVIPLTLTQSLTVTGYQLKFDEQDSPNLSWLQGETEDTQDSDEASYQDVSESAEDSDSAQSEENHTVTEDGKDSEQPIVKTRSQRQREKRRMMQGDLF